MQSIYSDRLAHVQVIINCQYSVAQMCTCKDMLAHYLGVPHLDDVMSQNELTTVCIAFSITCKILFELPCEYGPRVSLAGVSNSFQFN